MHSDSGDYTYQTPEPVTPAYQRPLPPGAPVLPMGPGYMRPRTSDDHQAEQDQRLAVLEATIQEQNRRLAVLEHRQALLEDAEVRA